MNKNLPQDDVTQILNDLADAVKELNSVNYSILRIVNDDWSKIREDDSQFLIEAMKTAQQLLQNDKLSDLDGKEFLGNARESSKLLLELKDFIIRLKVMRTYYELKQSIGEQNPNSESYDERQTKIQVNRKKLRDKRKKQ